MLMMQRDSLSFVGRNGEIYEFHVYPWGHEFDILPAVYVLAEKRTQKSGGEDYQILYIGETMDLSTEFVAHKHQESLVARNVNTIGVRLDPDPESRVNLARELSAGFLRTNEAR